jgi:hypothetical protein
VFYIGLGSSDKYFRAYTKHGRNIWWERVAYKHGFEVEILCHNMAFEEAKEAEKILISWYGRKDCCGGTLVNLTDGGEGTYGIIKSEDSIEKWRNSNVGKQDGELNTMFGKVRGKHHGAKEVLNLETGIYYDCALDASETTNIKYSGFKSKLNGRCENNTSFVYAEDFQNNTLKIKSDNPLLVKVINIKTKVVYDTIVQASKAVGLLTNTLRCRLIKGTAIDLNLCFLSEFITNTHIKAPQKNLNAKYILDTSNGVFYYSLKDASKYYSNTYSALKQMLNPNCAQINKTPLIYI